VTDQEIISRLVGLSAEYLNPNDPDSVVLRAAAERIRVLGEEAKAAQQFIDRTTDPDHERGTGNGFDEW